MFSKIYIPKRVYEEVCVEGMPGEREVRNAENIDVLEISENDLERMHGKISSGLDRGELEALALCETLGAKTFFTDDLDARDAGKKLGLDVHGSVGIVARAYRDGFINLDDAAQSLDDLYAVSKLFITKAIVKEAIRKLRMAGDPLPNA